MTTTDPFDGVPAPLRSAMERRGFTGLTPVQTAVTNAELAGRNLRISSQTGSGKTIAIGMVLAEALSAERPPDPQTGKRGRGPRALIIAPTRELAVQVQDELAWFFASQRNLAVAVVTGGSDLRRERSVLQRGPAVVVGTPGRMLDHIRSGALATSSVEEVVLDEADRMLDMGFREELEAIVESLPSKRRSHLVSATFGSAVRRLADRFQDNPVHLQGTALGAANEDIEHSAHLIRASDRYAALVNTLLVAQDSRCLVFVERRAEAADIAEKLARDGFAALPFSGELAQAQRTRTLAAFRNGSVGILVSTDVAARGIDVPDIGVVIQLTMPSDADGYTHRSGRTGRAGRTGRSVLLVPASAEHRARRLLAGAGIKVDWRPVPGPDQIRKMSRKALRRDLHGRLDASDEPSEQQLEYAASLIEKHDPLKVIATLMGMAEPNVARDPMPIASLVPGAKPARTSDVRRKGRDFVPFVINWGQKTGATTPRLLSHICRRGGIKAHDVGAIRVGPSSSRFEVSQQIAESFQRRVAKPDTRDPAVRISRDRRGPIPSGPRSNAHPSGAARTTSGRQSAGKR